MPLALCAGPVQNSIMRIEDFKKTLDAAEPPQLSHALRALRGSVLRTELYALDGRANSDKPYTVIESLFDVREIGANDPDAEDTT